MLQPTRTPTIARPAAWASRRARCAVVVALLAGSSCGRSATVSFARLAENAASWSASVQFAAEMARANRVPRAYLRDIQSAAGESVASLRDQIQKASGVDPAARDEAAALCGRLVSTLQGGDPSAVVDAAALRDLEASLRGVAQRARAGAAP